MQQSGQDNLIKHEPMKEEAFPGGGAKRIEAPHFKGKLMPMEEPLADTRFQRVRNV